MEVECCTGVAVRPRLEDALVGASVEVVLVAVVSGMVVGVGGARSLLGQLVLQFSTATLLSTHIAFVRPKKLWLFWERHRCRIHFFPYLLHTK